MKVCLIVPTLKQGGAERVISELASQFSQQGVEVHLILLAKAEDFYSIDCNVTIHRLGFVNKGRVQKIFSEIKTFFKLRGLLKEHKPDAVLSFMDKFNVFTILASRFLNLRVFVSDRSNPKLKLRPSLYVLKKLTYRYATGIIAQTTLAKEVIEKLTGNKNVQVIPNPLKKVQLYPGTPREKIILNVGRLVPEKGQQYLLQAFARLQGDDWKLVILGDGPLRDNLETQIINLNLSDKVEMPGATKDIDYWLAKSSIFVLSSISEGFPNVLIEAMSAGLPCISFDCDAGPRDIINDNVNGILIETYNTDLLSISIENLINDKFLYCKISSEALKAQNHYNIENIGNQYLNFLTNNEIKWK